MNRNPETTWRTILFWLFTAILLLIPSNLLAQAFEQVLSFETQSLNPSGKIVQGSDGNFYGTTVGGGMPDRSNGGCGSIFKMSTNGELTVVYSFDVVTGFGPQGLILGTNGVFYGTCSAGGLMAGIFFSVTEGGIFKRITNFDYNVRYPYGGVVQGLDGAFYGSAIYGTNAGGPVYRVTASGTVSILASVDPTNFGVSSKAPLGQSSNGLFYGSTYDGGSNLKGSIFKMSTNGVFTTLASFDGANGRNPYAQLVVANDGNLYGSTFSGGDFDLGTVFKMTPTGTLTTLLSFNSSNGSNPQAELYLAKDGNFYGTTRAGGTWNLGTVFKMTPGGSLTTLVHFDSTNGANPECGLLLAKDGNFYGTTFGGGPNNGGILYRLSLDGQLSIVGNFYYPHGSHPYGALLKAKNGSFYGTTQSGGNFGYGTVFKFNSAGQFSTIASFERTNRFPQTRLVEGKDGNFYGISGGGGYGAGALFKMTPSGALSNLTVFDVKIGNSGINGIIQATDGDFYGMGNNGYGSIFKFSADGKMTSLHSFDSTYYGPIGELIEVNPGNFYGATGTSGGAGSIFRVTAAGVYTTLFGTTTGYPSELTLGVDGYLYGILSGKLFRISTGGNFTNLSASSGWLPRGPLLQGSDGNFYGVGYPPNFTHATNSIFKVTADGVFYDLGLLTSANGILTYNGLVEGMDGRLYGAAWTDGPKGGGAIYRLGPSVAMKQLGPDLNLSWPVWLRNLNLESSTEISSGWGPVNPQTTLISNRYSTTIPAGPSTRFFRLKQNLL